MTVTKHVNGITVSDVINNHLVHKLYIGYSVREAKQKFVSEFYPKNSGKDLIKKWLSVQPAIVQETLKKYV